MRVSVGKDAQDAGARRERKADELVAKGNGIAVVPENDTVVTAAIADYLEETELTLKPKTLAAYTKALEYFTESCHELYIEDIERKDLNKFHAFLRDEKDQAPRSCWNKFSNVMSFLKAKEFADLSTRKTGRNSQKRSRIFTNRMNSILCSQRVTQKSGYGLSSS